MKKRKNGRNNSKGVFPPQSTMIAYNTCEKKIGYDSKEEAYQKGMKCYQCPFCGRWHRASIKNRGN